MTEQHPTYGAPAGHFQSPLFIDSKGLVYDRAVLSNMIRTNHKGAMGKHVRVQLESLNLIQQFDEGSTPFQVPYSIA